MPRSGEFKHVVMSNKEYDEYMAWRNRPRCPNEGSMCNCTGACQPKPALMASTNRIENHTLGLRLGDGVWVDLR